MIYFAVIDTNVLISGMLKRPSIPNDIIKKCLADNIIPLFNEKIIAEYREVTARPKFHFPISEVQTLLNSIIHRGIWQNPEPTYENLPDPKDLVFYETLLAARKKFPAYLVTGNLKHFPATDFIVSPHTMFDLSNTNNEKSE